MARFSPVFVATLAAVTAVAVWGQGTARAVDVVEAPPLDEAVRHVQRLVVPAGGAASIADALQRSVPRPSASSSAASSTSGSAGPLPGPLPLGGVVDAARGTLLWLLAAGGGVTAVGLGWRHLHRRNVLDHPARLAVLILVRTRPGLHLRALAREANLPVQHAAYHLGVLEKLGLVGSQAVAGKRRYYEAGVSPGVRRALLEAAALPSPAARDVLAFVAAHPGASQSEVARQLGMLPGRARWHLRKGADRGDLLELRQGKALTYTLRSAGPSPPVKPG